MSSGSKTYDLLLSGAKQLRISAEVFTRLAHAKGDTGLMAKFAANQLALALAMDEHAATVKPPASLRAWERGQVAAMKHLKAITAGSAA
jgi:hypothetical protein